MTSHSLSAQTQAAPAIASTGILRRTLATDGSIAPIALRLSLAIAMFPHGAQKLLGWFGGYGFEGTMGFLTEQIGLPWIAALAVVLLEFFAPLMLVAGLFTRFAGASLAAIMVGAVVTVHAQYGFFMNWTGAQAGEGFEYHLLAIGIGLALAFTGGGRWSVDRRLSS